MDNLTGVGKAVASVALCAAASFMATLVPHSEVETVMLFAIIGLVIIW